MATERNVSMLRKPFTIGVAFAVAALCTWSYIYFRIPSGATPMGDVSNTFAWISLLSVIISMITAIIGLVQKILESRNVGAAK